MWHKVIEEDLKTIFGIEKVLFCAASLEKERKETEALSASVGSADNKQGEDVHKENKDTVKEKEKTTQSEKKQDVLFCNIEKSINFSNKQGKEMARVYGKISITDGSNKNNSGFLSKKIQFADVRLTQKFIFSRQEISQESASDTGTCKDRQESSPSTGTCKDGFKVYSVNFIYFYKNKPEETTEKLKGVDFIYLYKNEPEKTTKKFEEEENINK
jgi:ribosomal protein S18